MESVNEARLGKIVVECRKRWVPLFCAWTLLFILPAIFTLGSDTVTKDHDFVVLLFGLLLLPIPLLLIGVDGMLGRIRLHERGLVKTTLLGTQWVSFDARAQFRYKVFVEVVYGVPTGAKNRFRVSNGKRRMEIRPSYFNMQDLHELLRNMELTHVYPAVREACLAGKTVDFGPIQLTQTELRHKDKKLALRSIERLEIEGGFLTITPKGAYRGNAFLSLQLSDISNPYTFLAVVPELGAVNVPQVVRAI